MNRKGCSMNREDPYRDQAERLRKRIEKINDVNHDKSQLPPRNDLHRSRKKKTKWKLKYPIIRLLVLFFILLPITIFSIYTYLEGKKPIGSEKVSSSTEGYESINLETPQKEEKKQVDDQTQKMDGKNESNDENVVNPSTSTEATEKETETKDPVGQETKESNLSGSVEKPDSGLDTDKNNNSQQTSPKSDSSKNKIIYHTVQPQETLYRIAMKYYHSNSGVEKIKQANHLSNNNIETGKVLKIPQ
jgi:LysM repeat protein